MFQRSFAFELFFKSQALQNNSTDNQTDNAFHFKDGDNLDEGVLILDVTDTNSTNTTESNLPEILKELNKFMPQSDCAGNTVWLDYANTVVVLWFTVELV